MRIFFFLQNFRDFFSYTITCAIFLFRFRGEMLASINHDTVEVQNWLKLENPAKWFECAVFAFVVNMLCLFKGPADPVYIPGNGIHQHSDHLQRHPQGGHRTADHAHSEILLLGCEPAGPQRNSAQRPR